VQAEVTKQLAGEQVRGIVMEEVTRQLAGEQLSNVVGEEVTAQLANLDSVVGEEITRQLDSFNITTALEITRQLADIDTLTVSSLSIKNEEGKVVGVFGVNDNHGGDLTLFGNDGKEVVNLEAQGYNGDNGALNIRNDSGEIVATLLARVDGPGVLILRDEYGYITFIQ
jgi:hypothetical protein